MIRYAVALIAGCTLVYLLHRLIGPKPKQTIFPPATRRISRRKDER